MRLGIFIVIILLSVTSLSFETFAQTQPNTVKQYQLLNREKEARTPEQQKIKSQLLQALKEQKCKPMATGVNLRPTNVVADKKGNLKVDINAEVTDELIKRIEALGGKIIHPSKQYHTIRAEINLAMVETIAGYPEVKFIEPAALATTNASGSPANKKSKSPVNLPK